ncbi:MAG: hypothetical protein WCA35_09895 [Kovacikia sp.]
MNLKKVMAISVTGAISTGAIAAVIVAASSQLCLAGGCDECSVGSGKSTFAVRNWLGLMSNG